MNRISSSVLTEGGSKATMVVVKVETKCQVVGMEAHVTKLMPSP